jgi:hypothetical protein
VFGTLKTRKGLRCLRYALWGTEAAGVEAAGGGRYPESFAGQTSGERISQPWGTRQSVYIDPLEKKQKEGPNRIRRYRSPMRD